MEKTQTRKYLPRLRREKENTPAIKFQPRDLEILKYVSEHRFLTTKQIQQLLADSYLVISKRLRLMFHNGYLDRLPTPAHEKTIYALGNKGADVLTDYTGIDRGKIDWTMKNREVRHPYVNHTLMIANFRVALALALKGTETELCRWIPESVQIRDRVMAQEGTRKIRIPFNPDAYIILKEKGKEIYTNFFLEADQSTMTNERYLRKMQGYWTFYKQGRHKEKFEIESFRVLTICKSRDRAENLRRTAKKADDNKTGSVMFWFTSESNYDPDKPETILGPIWQTPKNDAARSLLE